MCQQVLPVKETAPLILPLGICHKWIKPRLDNQCWFYYYSYQLELVKRALAEATKSSGGK